MFPGVLREWLIMRRSLRYGTLIFREFRRTNEGIKLSFGKAEEMRGDVASVVATCVQSFPCQGRFKAIEALIYTGVKITGIHGVI